MTTRTLYVAVLGAAFCFAGSAVQAASPYVHDEHHHDDHQIALPSFGMHSYNNGYGEQIVKVRHRGVAQHIGLEPGDLIVALNSQRLSYHGAWERALQNAMYSGGHIVLQVRDVHSGRLVSRHVDLDPYGNVIHDPVGAIGPITPKAAPVVRRSVGYRSGIQTRPQILTPRFSLRFGN